MLKLKTVSDVMPTRRDLLRYGGLGLAGATRRRHVAAQGPRRRERREGHSPQ